MSILWEIHKKRRNVNVKKWCQHREINSYSEFTNALVKEKFTPPEARDVDVLKYLATLGPAKPSESIKVVENEPELKKKNRTLRKTRSAKSTKK